MNILPDEQKHNLYKGLKIRFFIIFFIIISLSLIASSVMLVPGYLASTIELEEIISQTKFANSEINQDTQNIVALPGSINSKVRFIKSNSANKTAFSIIDTAVSKATSGIYISSISSVSVKDGNKIKIDGINLSGIAKDRKSLLDFSKALEEEESFSKVDVPVNSLTKDVNLPFSIKISISK